MGASRRRRHESPLPPAPPLIAAPTTQPGTLRRTSSSSSMDSSSGGGNATWLFSRSNGGSSPSNLQTARLHFASRQAAAVLITGWTHIEEDPVAVAALMALQSLEPSEVSLLGLGDSIFGRCCGGGYKLFTDGSKVRVRGLQAQRHRFPLSFL